MADDSVRHKNKKGETQMINHVTIGAVTHAHTQDNLMNNKKINICAIFMYFSHGKNR